MKKTLYMIFLLVSAIFGGNLIGSAAKGSFKWLGYSRTFSFLRDGDIINTENFKLNFGFYININVAMILFSLIAIFVYYKTVSKLFSGK